MIKKASECRLLALSLENGFASFFSRLLVPNRSEMTK